MRKRGWKRFICSRFVASKWPNHTPLPPSWSPSQGSAIPREPGSALGWASALQRQGLHGLQEAAYLSCWPPLWTVCSHGPALDSSLLLDSSSPASPCILTCSACSSLQVLLRHHFREALLSTLTSFVLPAYSFVLTTSSMCELYVGRDRDFCLILALCLTPGTKYTLNTCSMSGDKLPTY